MIPELEKIKRLLWEEWDPIGVNVEDGWLQDEYDSYAMRVFSMLTAGKSTDEIAEFLRLAETENMGLSPSNIHEQIAKRALQIHEECQ